MIAGIEQDIKEKIKGRVLYNEPMSRHTSFRIGGPADIWIEPEDASDLKNCIRLSRDKNIPLFVIGGGTNLLVKDEGIRGIVVNMLAPSLKNTYQDERGISATSSVTLGELLEFSSMRDFGGIEFLSGIPGTVGGAVATNAGARHYEIREKWLGIADFIEEVKTMDSIILEVRFLLTKSSKEFILNECRKFLKRKKATQELNAPSAGCIFKNPPDFNKSAGEMIEECNLKGLKIGGAAISKKHANFIINTGGARSGDVTALIGIIKSKVKGRFGIELFLEIKIV